VTQEVKVVLEHFSIQLSAVFGGGKLEARSSSTSILCSKSPQSNCPPCSSRDYAVLQEPLNHRSALSPQRSMLSASADNMPNQLKLPPSAMPPTQPKVAPTAPETRPVVASARRRLLRSM
jgi:hypothetical protein